jgi:glutamine synthetase
VIRIPGGGKRRHIEFRAGDNSCQPYLFLAGLLAAGLDGIRNRIDPGPAFQGDIAHITQAELEEHKIEFLPRTLSEAFSALENDPVIVDAVGEEALRHFLLVKRHEQELFQLHVHRWEREAYLEVI